MERSHEKAGTKYYLITIDNNANNRNWSSLTNLGTRSYVIQTTFQTVTNLFYTCRYSFHSKIKYD